MKSWHAILIVAVFGFGVVLGLSEERSQSNPDDATGPNSIQQPAVVLVELFTSEGCSICPPADRILADVVSKQPIAGMKVIGLSEHVDYWDRLGWKDPFSSSQFSARQADYSEAFGNTQIYTPQMIVDGTEEFVGSEARKLCRALKKAARNRKAEVKVSVPPGGLGDSDAVRLNVSVSDIPKEMRLRRVDVLLAITEDELKVQVPRGENAGKSLEHQRVVRRLKILETIDTSATQTFATATTVRLQPEWNRDRLRAVVFLQDRESRRVLGVTEQPLDPTPRP